MTGCGCCNCSYRGMRLRSRHVAALLLIAGMDASHSGHWKTLVAPMDKGTPPLAEEDLQSSRMYVREGE